MCYGGKTKANDINPLLLLFKIITALKKQSKCIKTNCKKLHDEFEKKNKKIEENKNKIMLDKKTSLVNKTKLIHKLHVDLLKTKERGEMNSKLIISEVHYKQSLCSIEIKKHLLFHHF